MEQLTAEELLAKCGNKSEHPFNVRKLSMMIFDEMSEKVKEMSNKQRKILDTAALLHDIGYSINSKGHNKHSREIVIENDIEGMDKHETELVGCVCRYHRGSLPNKEKHEGYKDLEKKDRKIVKRLGGILRLCDGLDTAHLGLIKKVKINYDEENNIVEIYLTPNTPEFRPDIMAAIRKRDLFEIGFKCQSLLKFEE